MTIRVAPRMLSCAIACACALALVLAVLPSVRADDVPPAIRPHYDEARQQLEAGQVKKAFGAISQGKAKCPASVDFWELYVEIYRRMGKKEKVLWGKIIPKAERKHPGSPVFHLLRHRLASDVEMGMGHLRDAMEVAPDALDPPALLARDHIRLGDGERAAPLIDAVLERDPTHGMALALRGDLELLKGLAAGARDHAEAHLRRHDHPALHDLLARALLAIPGSDAGRLERAEREAREALTARPGEWRFALTLAEALDRRGQEREARALLERAHGETPAPEMAAKLGEFAFREGDYGRAARGIALHPRPDVASLKALAAACARLGDADRARAALDRLQGMQDDDELRRFAAARALELGDARGARTWIQGMDGDAVERLELRAAAWAGDVAAAIRIAGKRAPGESRSSEEWLLPIAHALLLEKLGTRADAARKMLLDAAGAAARAKVATVAVPAEERLLTVYTLGYIQRYPTYRRCLDGSFFEPMDELDMRQKTIDDVMTPIAAVEGRSRCARDPQRLFPFRPPGEIRQTELQAIMTKWLGEPARKQWSEALGGFAQGGTALVRGDFAAAREAYGWVLDREPAWARARLLMAVAAALEGTDLADAARQAEIASETLIDDWDGRTAAVLVRYLAKQNVAVELRALAERRESFAPRRYEEL